jgi:hypothetical protein
MVVTQHIHDPVEPDKETPMPTIPAAFGVEQTTNNNARAPVVDHSLMAPELTGDMRHSKPNPIGGSNIALDMPVTRQR